MNTDCKKCAFHNSDSSWCEFSIPEILTNTKYVINDKNHMIDNYQCLYAFGKNTLETIKDETKDSIKQKILERNKLSFSLIVSLDQCNTDSERLCEMLNELDFRPKNILCYGKNIEKKDVSCFNKNSPIPWKLNKIQSDIADTIALVSSVDTFANKNGTIGFLHISSQDLLSQLDDIINSIHINIVINRYGGIMYKERHNINGMFMLYDDYKAIGTDKLILIDSPWLFFSLDAYKNTPVIIYD